MKLKQITFPFPF